LGSGNGPGPALTELCWKSAAAWFHREGTPPIPTVVGYNLRLVLAC